MHNFPETHVAVSLHFTEGNVVLVVGCLHIVHLVHPLGDHDLHHEAVLVAVVLQHVVVDLGHDAGLVLAVEEPHVLGVDLVLGLQGADQARNRRRILEKQNVFTTSKTVPGWKNKKLQSNPARRNVSCCCKNTGKAKLFFCKKIQPRTSCACPISSYGKMAFIITGIECKKNQFCFPYVQFRHSSSEADAHIC